MWWVSNRHLDSAELVLRGKGNTLLEGGEVLVKEHHTEKRAHIAAIFLKVLNENQINSPKLLRVENKKMFLEFLPGLQLKNLRERGIQRRLAYFQAQIHSLEWDNVLSEIDSRQIYKKNFRKYMERMVRVGLVTTSEADRLRDTFEVLVPEEMFEGPIHGNFWSANILVHKGELFLIDFGSTNKLSLEYDLLYANRTFTRKLETWMKGWCCLDTKYIKHYAEYGEKASSVLKNLEENYSFYYAFYAALKTAGALKNDKPKMARFYFAKLRKALNV